MVAVTAAPGTDILLRRAARMESRAKGELDVVHVISNDTSGQKDRRAIDDLRDLAAETSASNNV